MNIMKQLIDGNHPITEYLPKINDKKDLNGIMYLISNLSTRFYEHKFDKNCMSIDRDMRYSLFGQYNWRNNISDNKDHIFHKLFVKKIEGNSFNKATDGYEPTALLIDSYIKWSSKNPYYELIVVDNKPIITKNKEIVSDDNFGILESDKISSIGNYKRSFEEEIEINIGFIEYKLNELFKPLNEYIKQDTKEPNQELYDLLKYKIIPLQKFSNSIKNNENKLKITYGQTTSGRYYSIGNLSIHSLKKEVRNIILNDYNEYDICVSAPLLLSQIYKNITNEKVPSTIKDFIINKKRIREIFAQKYNISLDKSKEFFTSLFFGSRLIKNDFKFNSAVTQSLGIDVVNLILSDKTSYEYLLYKDVHKLFDVISNHYKKIDNTKVVGFNNHILELKKWNKSKVVSHLYQSLESVILDSMIKFYTTTTNDFNYVRVHDCIYTKKEINESKLYHFIKEETGIDTLFKEPISKQLDDDELYEMMKICNKT